jgi:hypothetical protein
MTPLWRDPRHTFPIGDATLICFAAVLAGLLPACGAVSGETADPGVGSPFRN